MTTTPAGIPPAADLRNADLADALGERYLSYALSTIVSRSLDAPARLIAANAGFEGAVIVGQVASSEGSIGFNAATGEFVDLVKAGVIDPAKVTRAALQNACSIAALLLTTEALIADKPEPAGAMPPGGGMGGMGGMPGMM